MAKQPRKSSTTKNPSRQLDAVEMLKADHKLVNRLFEQFHSASDDEKPALANRLYNELEIHTKLEEELFYPAVRTKLETAGAFGTESPVQGNGLDLVEPTDGDEELLGEEIDRMEEEEIEQIGTDAEVIAVAYEDHQTVKDLIQQLKTLDPRGSDYRELFVELEDAVVEHMTGEEDVILSVAAEELDVQALGVKMQQRRDDLSSSLAA